VITMRLATPDDTTSVFDLDMLAFVGDPSQVSPEQATSGLDDGRTFLAEHPDLPGELAGVYSSYDLQVRVPGTPARGTSLVPMNGLTWVAVHPDVRRRGVLSAMIRHHLEQAREHGEAMLALHASEPGIYGRFGYGVASHDVEYTLARGTRFAAPPVVAAEADGTGTRLLRDLDDDDVAARLRGIELDAPTLGTVVCPPRFWRRLVRDVPTLRPGTEPSRAFVATRDGRDVGMAVFSRSRRWEAGAADGTVTVHRLVASDAGALLALGRRLVDMDLMSSVRLPGRGLDDPLLAWAGGPRERRLRVGDALWLRPVDVGRMLEARGYASPLDVRLGVTDPLDEHNCGTWHLRVGEDGTATCERLCAPSDAGRTGVRPPEYATTQPATTQPATAQPAPAVDAAEQDGDLEVTADVSLDVGLLGEMFLGLTGARALAEQGRLVEHTAGAVAAMTRAFATGVAPIGGSSF